MASAPSSLSAAQLVHVNVEIRREIGSYLSKGELTTCARVSKLWLESASEVIWREVRLRQFMGLMESEVRALRLARAKQYLTQQLASDLSYSIFCPSSIYLHCIRNLRVDHGDLQAMLPSARLIMLRYPHIMEMKGDSWSIDFASKVITCSRKVDVSGPVFAMEKNGAISGFQVIETLRVHAGSLGSSEARRKRVAATMKENEGVRMIPLEDIIQYNVQADPDPSIRYAPIIRSLLWFGISTEKEQMPIWDDVPNFRYLDTIVIWDSNANNDQLMLAFRHFLGNRHIRQLDIAAPNVQLGEILDLVELAAEADREGGDLKVQFEAEISLEGAYDFAEWCETFKDNWVLPASRQAGASPRLHFECFCDIESNLTADERSDLDAELLGGQQYLNSLSDNITFKFNFAPATFKRGLLR